MTTLGTRPVRWYRGVIIHPKNVYGMHSAFVGGGQVAADTLAGMKELIRDNLKGAK